MTKKRKLRPGELGKYFLFFILPALVIYLLFSIAPFLYTIYYSFTDYTDMNPVNLHFVGLKNYIKVFQTPLMLTAIKNSVIYAILLTGFQTMLGLPLAENEKSSQGRVLFSGGVQLADHRISVEFYHVLFGLRADQ